MYYRGGLELGVSGVFFFYVLAVGVGVHEGQFGWRDRRATAPPVPPAVGTPRLENRRRKSTADRTPLAGFKGEERPCPSPSVSSVMACQTVQSQTLFPNDIYEKNNRTKKKRKGRRPLLSCQRYRGFYDG